MTESARRIILRVAGFAGALLFLAFFTLTYAVPEWVEKYAFNFLEQEVAGKVDSAIDNAGTPSGEGALSRVASTFYQGNENRIEGLKGQLKAQVHEQWADALAEIRNLDCECRAKWADSYERGMETEIFLLEAANEKITDFVQSSYMEVLSDLKRDIRIFTGSNAAMFLILVLLSFLNPKAISHLFIPALLLIASTIICSYFYIFEQNWLLTLIYSDYLGFAYLVYLGFVFLFLLDIGLGKGRVTGRLLGSIGIGSVGPC